MWGGRSALCRYPKVQHSYSGGFEQLQSSALTAATFSRRKLLWPRLAAAPVHGLMQNCHDWRQIDFRDLLNNMACIGQNYVLH